MKWNIKKKLRSSPLVNPVFPILAVVPGILCVVIFCLIPSIINLATSFTDYSGPLISFKFVGFENYFGILKLESGKALKTFGTTIVFSFFTVIIQQIVSVLCAVFVNQKIVGKNFFRAVFFMPTILGVTVIGFIWQMIFDPIGGPLAIILYKLFGIQSAFLGDPNIALGLVIMVTIWANFGFSMVIYLAGLQNIPTELKEAAKIDGATGPQIFRKITIPLLRAAFTTNLWISISGTLTTYDLIFVLTAGAAGTMTFALYFFNLLMGPSNKGQVAAMSIYFYGFITIVMLIFNAIFRRKEVEL